MATPPSPHSYDEEYLRRALEAQRGLPSPQALPMGAAPPAPQPPSSAMMAVDDALASTPVPRAAAAPPPAARQAFDDELTPLSMQSRGPKPSPKERDSWLSGALQTAGDFALGFLGAGDAVKARKDREYAEYRADPNSEFSVNMRKRMGPMLAQMGLSQGEIAALSGEDIQAVSAKGNLLEGVMTARQKAAAAKAKAAADAAALKDKREYERTEWDRQNAITAPQALERARAVGGMQEDRATRMAFLQHQLQGASEAARRAYQAELDKLKREWELEDEKRKAAAAAKAREDADRKAGKLPVNEYQLPGWTATNPRRAQQTIYDTERRQKMEDTADADAKIQSALASMREIHARVGTTVFDEQSASEYELARANAMGGVAALKGTGALNEADERRFAEMLPSIRPGMTWLDAKEAFGFGSKGDSLAGAATALRRHAQTHMRQFGFEPGSSAPKSGTPVDTSGDDWELVE